MLSFRVPIAGILDSRNQLAREIRFCNEPCRMHFGRLAANYSGIVLADEDNLGVRQVSQNSACGIQSIHARHGDIHQNNLRVHLDRFLNCLGSVGRLATNAPARMFFNQRSQAAAHCGMIICDQNFDGAHLSLKCHEAQQGQSISFDMEPGHAH